MIIKMGGDNIGRHIICRVLDWSKGVDIFSMRKHDDSTRMLSGTPANSGTTAHDTVDLTVSLAVAALFIIILHITVCRLFCKCSNGSGTEGLAFSENNLGVLMCLTLVISGEVQVDIRLFVSLESKESLKWNIKSVFDQLLSADRTVPVRHIVSTATHIFFHFFRIKITEMTVTTIIMRNQRINLCDSCHGCNERRSYRTTGAYQVTVLIGFPYQLLRNDIHNRKSIGNDGIQLSFQSFMYNLRERIPIHGMGFIITDISQHLVGILNNRRTLIRTDR